MSAPHAFVDAHLHLWDRGRLRYPWLEAAETAAIAGDYGVPDYRAEAAGWRPVAAVHVDAGAHPEDGEAETLWLEGEATRRGLPTAIVARVELHDAEVDARLAWQAARPLVRGIRHLINWHPADPGGSAYPDDLTRDAAWQRGYARLGDHGLSFDFHGHPPQLAGLAVLAERHPGTSVAINHLGLPRPAEGLATWRAGMRALAAMPHVAVKLSGAGFIASPFDPAAFADIVAEVIEGFGPDRVMIATNFPTDRLFASMDATLTAYRALLDPLPAAAQRAIWGGTANCFYRLGLKL
ncbi:MAG TPA: amidohydrolase [Sphingomonas bacterium]|uniref:Amidohydrolase n=1 Tax=Sphingomonas bacterium TaxID=1895847 RepID=A0A3D0W8S8_9SPHN|nr:amidohydrolase [Sphingomonas bacterium]